VPSAAHSVDRTIRAAIAERRLVSFELDGLPRIGEPHDYGISGGVHQLSFYQVGGKSSSGAPLGWRIAVLSKVAEMKMLEGQFAGPRPAPSGRHKKWDKLIASVSLRESKDGD
jgi:hypothetical protein